MIDRFRGEYSFLSNMYSVPGGLEFVGHSSSSVEVAYHWMLCDSEEGQAEILAANDGAAAKRIGRKYPRIKHWLDVNMQIMEVLLRGKFESPEMGELLLATGNEEIVEGNTHGDDWWGVSRGRGHNHLGKMLMIVRAELASIRDGLHVHTDYWGRRPAPEYARIGICRNMMGIRDENIIGLAPSSELRDTYKKSGDWALYTERYWDEIDKWMASKPGIIGYTRYAKLWSVMRIAARKVLKCNEFALTCFEKPGDNCHRHILFEALDPRIRGDNN